MVSPNGRYVAYTGYDDQMFTFHLQNLYLMEASGADQKLLGGSFPSSPSQVEWAPDSSGLYYVMQEKGEAQLYFLPLKGGPKRMTSGTHVLTSVSLSQKGQAAAVRTSFHEPGTLVTFDLKTPGADEDAGGSEQRCAAGYGRWARWRSCGSRRRTG
jgi:hypothetical protein